MSDHDGDYREPPNLRLLRRLVTALLLVMIVGFIAIAAFLIIQVTNLKPAHDFPDAINVPEGMVPTAVTRGDGWIAVVTTSGEILIFDASGQELLQSIAVGQ